MSNKEQSELNTLGKASCVKFTAQEYRQIKKIQQATGDSIPAILKTAVFKGVKDFKPLMDRESADQILKELKRIGNNINQISRHLNAGFGYESCRGFPEICDHLRSIRNIIVVKSGINQR